MKRIIFFIALISLASCWDNVEDIKGSGPVTPANLQLTVKNADGEIVTGATVELYSTFEDYMNSQNKVQTATTDGSGHVLFPLTGLKGGLYYYNVVNSLMRNWKSTVNIGLTASNGTSEIGTTISEISPEDDAKVSGPASFVAGQSARYSLPNYPGTYKWTVVSGENFTISGASDKPSINVTSNQIGEGNEVVLKVEYTLQGFEKVTKEIEVTVKGFCPYDNSTWEGDYEALEDYGDGDTYGPYDVTFIQDETNPHKFSFDNFWDSGISTYIIFDPNSFAVTFPDQEDEDGNPITGAGEYDQCSNAFLITTEYLGYTFDYVFVKK